MERTAGRPAEGARRLLANAAWLLSGQLVSKLASVVFVVIVARAVGVQQYGYFTFATAFVPLFLAFGTLGLDTAVVRQIARDREQLSEVFSSGLYLRLLTGGLALVLSLAFAPLFADARVAVVTVLVVGVALFLDEMTAFVSTVFKAFERMRFHAMGVVVNRTVSTGLALVAYLADAGLPAIIASYFLGSVGALIYAFVSLRRHFPPVHLSDARRATAMSLLRIGIPLGVAAVLNMALFRLDTVMVQGFEGSRAVGYYGVAFRFFESFLFLTWVMSNLTFPRISRQGRGTRSARTLELSSITVVTCYLPLAVGSLFLAPWAVSLLFGSRYAEAATAVPWLTLALVCYGVTYQVRTSMMALGGGTSIAWVAAIALALNVPLNVVLIPRFGFLGAGIATGIVSVLEVAMTVASARGLELVRAPSRLAAAPVLAAGTMALVLFVIPDDGGLAAAAGAVTYLVTLAVAAIVLAPAQLREVRTLLRRSPKTSSEPSEPPAAALQGDSLEGPAGYSGRE